MKILEFPRKKLLKTILFSNSNLQSNVKTELPEEEMFIEEIDRPDKNVGVF